MQRPILLGILVLLLTACSTYQFSSDPYIVGIRWFDRNYFEHARNIWEPLASKGDCDAQYRMGTLYFLGTGTQKDFKIAHQWFTSAANQGQAIGQHLLGIMYAHGYDEIRTPNMIMAFNCINGCDYEKDMVTAYQWARLAERYTPYESHRKSNKAFAEKYKKQLTAEQIAKANQFIEAWKPYPAQCEQRQVR